MAQWIARWTSNPEAAGSNPAGDENLVSLDCCLTSFGMFGNGEIGVGIGAGDSPGPDTFRK